VQWPTKISLWATFGKIKGKICILCQFITKSWEKLKFFFEIKLLFWDAEFSFWATPDLISASIQYLNMENPIFLQSFLVHIEKEEINKKLNIEIKIK
jgi:hypothetical protein